MIEHLRAKASRLGLSPSVTVADMRDFTLPRRYAVATIPFRSFMHLQETGHQMQALRCIREHLEPGGRLVMNLFFPNFREMAKREGRTLPDREFAHRCTAATSRSPNFTRYDRVTSC